MKLTIILAVAASAALTMVAPLVAQAPLAFEVATIRPAAADSPGPAAVRTKSVLEANLVRINNQSGFAVR